jgi:hypothetical protein
LYSIVGIFPSYRCAIVERPPAVWNASSSPTGASNCTGSISLSAFTVTRLPSRTTHESVV